MGAKESVLEISFLAFLHTEEFESITCLFSFLKSSLQNTNYVMEKKYYLPSTAALSSLSGTHEK